MEEQQTTEELHKTGPPAYPGIPRWVKVLGIVVIVLALLIAIALATGLGGPHGPARHAPSGHSSMGPALMFGYTSSGLDNHRTSIEQGRQFYAGQSEHQL